MTTTMAITIGNAMAYATTATRSNHSAHRSRENAGTLFQRWRWLTAKCTVYERKTMDGWIDGWMVVLFVMCRRIHMKHLTLDFIINLFIVICTMQGARSPGLWWMQNYNTSTQWRMREHFECLIVPRTISLTFSVFNFSFAVSFEFLMCNDKWIMWNGSLFYTYMLCSLKYHNQLLWFACTSNISTCLLQIVQMFVLVSTFTRFWYVYIVYSMHNYRNRTISSFRFTSLWCGTISWVNKWTLNTSNFHKVKLHVGIWLNSELVFGYVCHCDRQFEILCHFITWLALWDWTIDHILSNCGKSHWGKLFTTYGYETEAYTHIQTENEIQLNIVHKLFHWISIHEQWAWAEHALFMLWIAGN